MGSMPIRCPVCDTVADLAAQVRAIGICGTCGSSLVVDDAGTVRRATAADTVALGVVELATLVHARGGIVRPKRK